MNRSRMVVSLTLALFLAAGCDPEWKREDKYARPDWLAGKVYTQLKAQPQLSTFAQCIALTGYDTILDVSGSYTIFAPSNDAFTAWFAAHPLYNSVEDIPMAELNELVKYHVVQNPWTKTQLRTLDIYGWIDTLDINNNKPKGFKRQTLLLDENRKLGLVYQKDKTLQIVDTLETDWHRIVITDSRKYVPIFFQEYFDIYDLSPADYQFYFDRNFDNPQDLYFANGKVIGEEIFAENGFVYEIDRVVDPLPNAFQMLENGTGSESYSDFMDLLNQFPQFQYNEDETFDQPGAEEGLQVDSLFNLTYPELAFDILNENTTPPTGTFGLPENVTIRYHHGVVAPTNQAFAAFLNEYIAGPGKWGTIDDTPRNIKRIIANTHLSANSIYPTDFTYGFINGESDVVTVAEGNIIEKGFGSNCTFIGVDATIVPRVFTSVAGPVYMLKGYSTTMYAIEEAGLLSALKREGENYRFYVESNANCSQDSSLLYDPGTGSFSLFQIAQGSARRFGLNESDLRDLLMSHIAVGSPSGVPRKEFIRNIAGNFLVINNETGEVSGTAPTSVGYQGLEYKPNYPTQISTNADNGVTYDIENWFSFSATSMYQLVRAYYPVFHNLLVQTGLANEFELRYTFLSPNEDYTLFAPVDSAFNEIDTDTMELEELQNLLRFHFVQGDLIFTDGAMAPGYYETSRKDERSTTYTTIYTKLYIAPGTDVISIGRRGGGSYLSLEESPVTNVMTGRDAGEDTQIFHSYIINGVIHEIGQLLLFEGVDTN